jgi:hypothetical protein
MWCDLIQPSETLRCSRPVATPIEGKPVRDLISVRFFLRNTKATEPASDEKLRPVRRAWPP